MAIRYYTVCDYDGIPVGAQPDEGYTLKDARARVTREEETDKQLGIYTKGFYHIKLNKRINDMESIIVNTKEKSDTIMIKLKLDGRFFTCNLFYGNQGERMYYIFYNPRK